MRIPTDGEGALELHVDDARIGNSVLLSPVLTEMISVNVRRVEAFLVLPSAKLPFGPARAIDASHDSRTFLLASALASGVVSSLASRGGREGSTGASAISRGRTSTTYLIGRRRG